MSGCTAYNRYYQNIEIITFTGAALKLSEMLSKIYLKIMKENYYFYLIYIMKHIPFCVYIYFAASQILIYRD